MTLHEKEAALHDPHKDELAQLNTYLTLLERTLAFHIRLAARLSVCPSFRLADPWNMTKGNNRLSIYQHGSVDRFFYILVVLSLGVHHERVF